MAPFLFKNCINNVYIGNNEICLKILRQVAIITLPRPL